MIQVNGPMVRLKGTSTILLAEYVALTHSLRNALIEDDDCDEGKANLIMTQCFVDALSFQPDQDEKTEGDTT